MVIEETRPMQFDLKLDTGLPKSYERMAKVDLKSQVCV